MTSQCGPPAVTNGKAIVFKNNDTMGGKGKTGLQSGFQTGCEEEGPLSKKRFPPEEIIRWQQGEAVCAGFAFYPDTRAEPSVPLTPPLEPGRGWSVSCPGR